MTGIPVSVAPATAEGRLYPRYHNSVGILTLGTSTPRPCRFGVNLDASLILDFDEGGVLADAELMIPMRRWKGKASTSRPGGAAGNIVLAGPRPTNTYYDWPVTVSNDVQTDAGRIGFGSGDYNRSVRLSEACCALLLDDQLTGFWFTLEYPLRVGIGRSVPPPPPQQKGTGPCPQERRDNH